MFRAVDYPDENLLALYIGGMLTKADYQGVVPTLEKKVQQYGKVNAYLEYQGIEDVTLKALWEELKEDVKHFTSFNRVAVVSNDNTLVKAGAALSSVITPSDVKHFNPDEKTVALQWVRGENAVASPRTVDVYSS
ncbi:STAS/SEC14 domain-containing protein [Hymenobacter defluvii]|uniref:STAS/SEC14 domain-containing protein n=1 Tax=Hymenobacter defluvii TaxID=2054411 RepID=A0ABS3TBK0_9BACT|nr:STAS/SEC14 domain-containing protein [Hymenobacter defluvii]MBO3271027.1 STAS/SEC14 domain-containing protein [Hymenobacter defluvii]